MNAVGIIAEYNPFHNGHAYQIQKAKEIAHADIAVVAMSGNFVQRGAPAILDKFSRAAMAIKNGADFVFEIPTLFATASAEYFAAAGISLFHALGCVDAVSFGCETPDLPLLWKTAELLSEEPEAYRRLLGSYLKQGLAFPSARERAAVSYFRMQDGAGPQPYLSELLRSPNNILALEYMKALFLNQSSMKPLPVKRQGTGYHDTEFTGNFCSASAIRSLLLSPKEMHPQINKTETLRQFLPVDALSVLLSPGTWLMSEDDFSEALFYKLLNEKETGYAAYADASLELSNRIRRLLSDFTGFSDFCRTVKTKNVTHTRISRLMLHILLNIKSKDYPKAGRCGCIPYLRLLGFRKESAGLFQAVKKQSSLPLIVKPARDASCLGSEAASMFRLDVSASDLYYGILAQKSKRTQKNECQRKLAVISRPSQ